MTTKHYILRDDQPDFVCMADTVADAIVLLWLATRETPRASYRVHEGRVSEARTISAAVAVWRIHIDLRAPLFDVLQEVSTEAAFTEFCEITVSLGQILGK